jgi:hypothetical protein
MTRETLVGIVGLGSTSAAHIVLDARICPRQLQLNVGPASVKE